MSALPSAVYATAAMTTAGKTLVIASSGRAFGNYTHTRRLAPSGTAFGNYTRRRRLASVAVNDYREVDLNRPMF
jgi:hypothetical protein